jgi:uncharacterized metal-binding protein
MKMRWMESARRAAAALAAWTLAGCASAPQLCADAPAPLARRLARTRHRRRIAGVAADVPPSRHRAAARAR